MPIYCYILKERRKKTERILGNFAKGCDAQLIYDEHLRTDGPAVFWGQIYASQRLMRECIEKGIDFYQIDNGYFHAARGTSIGYFRVTKNALAKNWVDVCPDDRWKALNIPLMPWRQYTNTGIVVLCVPGRNFGAYMGMDMDKWAAITQKKLSTITYRKVYIRPKLKEPSLLDVLYSTQSHCVVTHSSNAAVEAVIAGFPVFCHDLCAAHPVANSLEFDRLEDPLLPDRQAWVNSLAYGQFTLEEFSNGTAWSILRGNL